MLWSLKLASSQNEQQSSEQFYSITGVAMRLCPTGHMFDTPVLSLVLSSQQSNHSDFESAPAAHQLTPPSPVSCFPCWLAHWQLATLLLWWSLVSFHLHHGEDDINKTRLFMTGDSSPSPAARHTRLQSRHRPQYKKVERSNRRAPLLFHFRNNSIGVYNLFLAELNNSVLLQ